MDTVTIAEAVSGGATASASVSSAFAVADVGSSMYDAMVRITGCFMACFAFTAFSMSAVTVTARFNIQAVLSWLRPWVSRTAWFSFAANWCEYLKSIYVMWIWCPVVLRASSNSMVTMYAENVDWSHIEYTTDAFPFLCEALMQGALGARIGLFLSSSAAPLKIAIVEKSEPALTFARHELTGTAAPIISTRYREMEVPVTPFLRLSNSASTSTSAPPTPTILPATVSSSGNGRSMSRTSSRGTRSRSDSMSRLSLSATAVSNGSFASAPQTDLMMSDRFGSRQSASRSQDGGRADRACWDKLASCVMKAPAGPATATPSVSPSTSTTTMPPMQSKVPGRKADLEATTSTSFRSTSNCAGHATEKKTVGIPVPSDDASRPSPSPWQRWFKSVIAPVSHLRVTSWWWQRQTGVERPNSQAAGVNRGVPRATAISVSEPVMTVFKPTLPQRAFTSASFGVVKGPMWGLCENNALSENAQVFHPDELSEKDTEKDTDRLDEHERSSADATAPQMPHAVTEPISSTIRPQQQGHDEAPNMAPLVSFKPEVEESTAEAFATKKLRAEEVVPTTACLLHEVERRMKLLLPTLSMEGTLFGFVILPQSKAKGALSGRSGVASASVDSMRALDGMEAMGGDAVGHVDAVVFPSPHFEPENSTSDPTNGSGNSTTECGLSQSEVVQEAVQLLFREKFERVTFSVEGRLLMVSGSTQKR